jgi:hypothetical protein
VTHFHSIRTLALGSVAAISLLAGTAFADVAANINAAVLPSSRTTTVDTAITVFASIVNAGPGTARACEIGLQPNQINGGPNPPGLSSSFRAFEADNATPSAGENVPVDIADGAAQSFVVSIAGEGPFEQDIFFRFFCQGGVEAPVFPGVNTLQLVNSTSPIADIITIGTSPTKDGIIAIPALGAGEIMAVAAVNIGSGPVAPETPDGVSKPAAGANQVPVVVVPDFGDFSLALDTFICETDPETAVCLAPYGRSVKTLIGNQPSTFNVFVNSNKDAGIPLYPDIARQFLRFYEDTGFTSEKPEVSKPAALKHPDAGSQYGATSHAVTSPGPDVTGLTNWPDGIWDVLYTTADGTRLQGGVVVTNDGAWTAIIEGPDQNKIYQFGSIPTTSPPATPDPTLTVGFENIEFNSSTDTQGGIRFEGSGSWRPKAFMFGQVSEVIPPPAGKSVSKPMILGTQSANFRATYNALYDREVTISSMAGDYDMVVKDLTNQTATDIGDISFDIGGAFHGSVTPEAGQTCQFSGIMFSFGNGKNLFNIDTTFTDCAMADFYVGNAFQYDDEGELAAGVITSDVIKMVITSTTLDPIIATDIDLVRK